MTNLFDSKALSIFGYGSVIILFFWLVVATVAGDECVYQDESFGKSFDFSTARLIRFLDSCPSDVQSEIDFQGKAQFYGQIRYGSEDGTRIAIVLDQLADEKSDFDLYVDANRDRKLESSEQVEGTGIERTFSIKTQINRGGIPQHYPRTVTLRRSLASNCFTIKTHGGCVGQFELGDKTIQVRRIDGDGNGLFADSKDQIWLDLNGDNQWNPISERFPFQLALRIADKRYSVRGDQLGNRFRLEEIQGEGTVKIEVSLENEKAKIKKLNLSLYGDDGSSFLIDGTKPVTLPVGKYMVGEVSIHLLDGESPEPWYFAFSHSGREGDRNWYTVKKDREVNIDPFGDFDFQLSGDKSFSEGKSVSVRPVLRTGDGLYITTSGRGEPDRWGEADGNTAKLYAMDASQNVFGNCESGFR